MARKASGQNFAAKATARCATALLIVVSRRLAAEQADHDFADSEGFREDQPPPPVLERDQPPRREAPGGTTRSTSVLAGPPTSHIASSAQPADGRQTSWRPHTRGRWARITLVD